SDNLRVVRLSRRTPSSLSSALTRRLSFEVCSPSASAAAVKLPKSTTLAKKKRLFRSWKGSMGGASVSSGHYSILHNNDSQSRGLIRNYCADSLFGSANGWQA